MNKADFIKKVAEQAGVTNKQADLVLSAIVSSLHDVLKAGDEVTIPELGKFSREERAARKGRNPSTGEEIEIPAKNVPKFSAAKALKDALAG